MYVMSGSGICLAQLQHISSSLERCDGEDNLHFPVVIPFASHLSVFIQKAAQYYHVSVPGVSLCLR